MADNEYRPKEDYSREEEAPKQEKKPKKEKSDEKPKLKNPISGLSGRFDKKKIKTVTGGVLILLSFYLFLACLSYVFTWTEIKNVSYICFWWW